MGNMDKWMKGSNKMKDADKLRIRNQRFFDNASLEYHDFIEKSKGQNRINNKDDSKNIIEARIGERVLDVGNGGVRGLYPPQTSFYVGIDFSLKMLRGGKNRSYDKVCGEALNLPFKERSFNTILYSYLLHHLAKEDIGTTLESVKKALRGGSTCLKAGGNVVITETCLPSFLEKVERAFFSILRILLFFTRQSEVFLFSAETLTRILTECGYREITVWKVYRGESPWKWVRISIGFPRLKIPRWMNPSRIIIFEAKHEAVRGGT
jgi:ubiquinone/menaquinone biosynthesis C-methylase UbiE